jgi:hypothetical protein
VACADTTGESDGAVLTDSGARRGFGTTGAVLSLDITIGIEISPLPLQVPLPLARAALSIGGISGVAARDVGRDDNAASAKPKPDPEPRLDTNPVVPTVLGREFATEFPLLLAAAAAAPNDARLLVNC